MTDYLPGGRGERFGPDANTDRDEESDLRRRLRDAANGWIISTAGEIAFGMFSTTGVSAEASRLSFFYVPPRLRTVSVSQARVNVASAVAASTYRTALYIFDRAPMRRLVQIPGTEIIFDSSSTGLKTTTLTRVIDIPASAQVFVARWASDASIVVEGFESGASATPRVLRQRTIGSVTPPLQREYAFGQIPVATSNADTPYIAYLSPEAVEVF